MNLIPLDEIVFQAEPHTYYLRGKAYDSVTSVLTSVLGDPFEGCPPDRLEFAQGRGNAVHLAAALLTAGELDWGTVDPRIEGYVRAVERFHKECAGPIVYTEKRMVSPEIDLGGTPDLVKFIRGRRSLVDYKTSQQMKPRMCLQTAAYKILHDTIFPNSPIYDRYGLRLSADGTYKLIQHPDPDDALAFMDMMAEKKASTRAERWKAKYA